MVHALLMQGLVETDASGFKEHFIDRLLFQVSEKFVSFICVSLKGGVNSMWTFGSCSWHHYIFLFFFGLVGTLKERITIDKSWKSRENPELKVSRLELVG